MFTNYLWCQLEILGILIGHVSNVE